MSKKQHTGDLIVNGKLQFGQHHPNFVLAGAGYAGSTGALSTFLESGENKHFMDFRLKNTYPAATVRGMYLRVRSYGAASSGEAIRAYYESYGTQGTSHGIHATMSVCKTGAAITGGAYGIRATLDTLTGLTLTTSGTYAALRLDTNLNSSLASVAKSSMIYMEEIQSSKVGYTIHTVGTGCGVAANTHSIDSHALAYVMKCHINGVDAWIPLFAAVPA